MKAYHAGRACLSVRSREVRRPRTAWRVAGGHRGGSATSTSWRAAWRTAHGTARPRQAGPAGLAVLGAVVTQGDHATAARCTGVDRTVRRALTRPGATGRHSKSDKQGGKKEGKQKTWTHASRGATLENDAKQLLAQAGGRRRTWKRGSYPRWLAGRHQRARHGQTLF